MPVVNPGIRRFLGSAIQRLFNSASFAAPLTHSAVPERASSGTTATFTRATTATVRDNEGVLRTAIAGEARFEGARRVRNLFTFTEDIGNAAWTKRETTYSGGRLIETAATADHSVWEAASTTAGNYYVASGHAKADQNSVIQITFSSGQVSGDPKANFNLSTGALGTVDAGLTAEIEAAPDIGQGYYRVSVKAQAASTSLTAFFAMVPLPTSVRLANYAGNISNGLYLNKMQLEDVTAQTTQTAGEYVSVGVPSDWAGDELVTNGTFDSDTTGWTAVNSTFSQPASDLRITNVGANAGYGHQAITTVIGQKYVCSASITVGTSSTFGIYFGNGPGAGSLGGINGSASGVFSAEFTATATTTYISPINTQAVDGRYTTFDNISVKPAYYHGSFVDGVKCFPTDINGAAIPSTTLLGYVAEGARTNLCLQSNAFTTTWAAIGTPAATQDTVGPDGSVSAWTLTDNAAGSSEGVTQNITLTAAVYTMSVFVKKTSGAQASYPVIYAFTGTTIALATIDTSNGVATSWTAFTGSTILAAATARCTSYNANYWRVELSYTGSVAAYSHALIAAGTTNATQSTGTLDATVQGSAVFYGAQVELGSFASSYIATTTAAGTRNADTLTYSGGDIPNLKTLLCDFERASGVSSQGAQVTLFSSATNYATTYLDTASTLYFQGAVTSLQWQQTASNAYTPGTRSKVVWSMAANDIKMAKDGVAQTPDASASMPTVASLQVGYFNTGLYLNGNIGGIYGWTRNLSQSEENAVSKL